MRVSFFAYPVHPTSWQRPTGSRDYRITAGFRSPDLLNGGTHRAVDVGNFRQGDPVRSPASCTALGLKHSDGALGVRLLPPNGEVWELWHLDRVDVAASGVKVSANQQLGTTGDTGARLPSGEPMGAHTHIELERNGLRVDPEPYLLGADYAWTDSGGDDAMPRLKPVREEWDIPAGTAFWLDGPESGPKKTFSTLERRWSNNESADTLWRTVERGAELLWVKRAGLKPRSGTRNPASGYGSPAMGVPESTAKARERTAADAVLEASKTAAKKYGAT